MNVQINYVIHRIDAIKAGKNEWGTFALELNPAKCPEGLREELAIALDSESPINDTLLRYKRREDYFESFHFNVPLVDCIELENAEQEIFKILQLRINTRKQVEEKVQKELEDYRRVQQKKHAELITLIEHAIMHTPNNLYLKNLPTRIGYMHSDLIDVEELSFLARQNLDMYLARREEEERAKEEQTRRKEEIEKTREARRIELRAIALDNAVAALGDDADKTRLADDTMSDGERRAYRSAWLFGDVGSRFEKIKKSDCFCDNCNADWGVVKEVMGRLNKTQWLKMETLKQEFISRRLGELDVSYRLTAYRHVATCTCGESTIERNSVLVEAISDEISFASRELTMVE